MQTLLRLNAVIACTGLRRSTIYERVADKSFPSPIKLGAKSVAWIQSEIQEWQEQRIAESRQNNQKNKR